MRKSLFILFAVLLPALSFSQPVKQFSKNPQTFIEELTKMFDQAQTGEQKASGKAIMADFSAMMLGNGFSPSEKDSVYEMCNIMLRRKMKTFPHFETYLKTVILFARSEQEEESFEAWQLSLRKLAVMSNSIRFMTLLETTHLLLSNSCLHQTQILSWKTDNTDFTFGYDSLPFVEFRALNLRCVKKNDSTTIYDTKGRLYPTSGEWFGYGGKMLWERASMNELEVFAELKKYSISIKKSEFTIDTVTFYHKGFFDRPLYGRLDEKVMADVAEERVSYPRFTSFDKRLQIKGLFREIDYEGGFAMYGSKLMGMGDKEQDARITFFRNGKPFLRLISKAFVIRPEMISSDKSAAVIYYEKDSIYHPGLKVRYINEGRELSLMRGDIGISESPYFNSYHKIDMYFEALYWKMDEPKMELKMLKGAGSESSAVFESDNYYSAHRYDRLRGLDDIHPLQRLRDITREYGTNVLTVDDVVRKMRIAKEQVQAMLINFANKGFVIYDIDNDIVVVKDRVHHYVNAKIGKTDYDIIQFNSVIAAQSNATLNLLNFDLKIRGVPIIYLSDSQYVYVIPAEQEIILKKNRDFEFDGQIHSGLFDFYGKKFKFNYDMFRIDMPMVDSMSFKVQDRSQPKDIYGRHPLIKVRTVIENLNGEMVIDQPGNKSGLKSFPEFPSFTSKKDAYVYYDKGFIYNGVYKRDKFYYRLQPFKIDSLDNYASERKVFRGYLVSAGIFPDITEPLRVQPDYSLGFVMKTPEGGYPAYGGKGRYDSIIDLSYKGFRGSGKLKYLTSITYASDILFFPDSMLANAEKYVIKEKATSTEYPAVYAEDVGVRWHPYTDRMNIIKKNKPIDLYASQAMLNGNLSLSPGGLSGNGLLTFSKVEMRSEKYKFKHHTFSSDTTDVKFRTPDLNDIVLYTENFNVQVDFREQLGKFKSNEEDSRIRFPFNQYACNLYNFDWYMQKDLLKLHSGVKDKFSHLKTASKQDIIASDLTESRFVSEHPAQDSLWFYAPIATYNLSENIIHAFDVPVIFVADAAIFPDSGKVDVLRKAEMTPLFKSSIIANTESKLHFVYDAKTEIFSQKKYKAAGSYDYTDENGDKQKLYLHEIIVDAGGQTTGYGEVAEISNFSLSPYFGFTGSVNMFADKEFLNFKGGVSIRHKCDTVAKKWMRFEAEIDPANVAIPVGDKPREYVKGDPNGKELGLGIYAGEDTTMLYTAFVQSKNRFSDDAAITASGLMTFDKLSQKYVVAPIVDSSKASLPAGNILNFDRLNCLAWGTGRIDLGTSLGQVKMQTYGSVANNMIDRSSSFVLVMLLDFFFDDKAMAMFTQSLEKQSGTEGVNTADDNLYMAMNFLSGAEMADKYLTQLSLTGRIKELPKELNPKIFLADVKLKWNPKTRSLVSDGSLGIAAVNGSQIYKYVDGVIEIARKRSGNILNMYFEFGSDWYFFSYQSNKMQAYSSRADFNLMIKEAMTAEKNILKTESGEAPYAFIIATEKRKKDFLKKVGYEEDGGQDPDSDE